MNDSEIRKLILGTWICTEKMTPHRITYRSNGTIQVIMTVNNLLNPLQLMGAFVKLFSGDTCEGNYSVSEGMVILNLETVPKSWLNIRIMGINLSFGDILTRVYGTFFTATNQSKLKVLKITSTEMQLGQWWDPTKSPIHFEKSE